MTRAEQKALKAAKEEESYIKFPWENNISRCFDIGDSSYLKMWEIINYARSQNRGIKPDSICFNVHHIVPRSFYKKINIPVDNREINLVKLTLPEHFMVHYYAWKCSKKEIRPQMAAAFHLMVGRATLGLDNAPSMSVEELSELMIPQLKARDKKARYGDKIKKLEKEFGKLNYTVVDDNHLRFQCKECGEISTKFWDANFKPICRNCSRKLCEPLRSDNHYAKGKYYPNKGTLAVVCVNEEGKAFWKLLSFRCAYRFATRKYLDTFIHQNENYSQNYLLRVYDDSVSKGELTKHYTEKFGEHRSWDWYRNVYTKTLTIFDKENNPHKIEDPDYSHYKDMARRHPDDYFAVKTSCLHWLYSLACEDRSVLDRLMEVINKMGELNNWKEVKDFN